MRYDETYDDHMAARPGQGRDDRAEGEAPRTGRTFPDGRGDVRTAAGRPAVPRPAHPLPAVRRETLNYDQYLERSTDKFQIFSAQERRKRRKALATAAVFVVLVSAVICWVLLWRT